jgi:dipeptidyl aminopeptidase/acylaminoacyl peptidase
MPNAPRRCSDHPVGLSKARFIRRWTTTLGIVFLLGVGQSPSGQTTPTAVSSVRTPIAAPASRAAKTPIPQDAYDGWKSIARPVLSRNGIWLVYALVAQDGDGELVARNLNTGVEHRVPRGIEPVITPDSAFAIFPIAPAHAALATWRKAGKKPGDTPRNGLGVMTLATGQVWSTDRVKNVKAPQESSVAIAYLREPAPGDKASPAADVAQGKKTKEAGTPLIVRHLQSGVETTLADVTEYEWSKDGSWLAFAVSQKTNPDAETQATNGDTMPGAAPRAPQQSGDGAFARRTSDGTVRTLMSGLGRYKRLAFDGRGDQLAFLGDRDEYGTKSPRYRLYRWTTDAAAATEMIAANATGLPRDAILSEHDPLEFSKDGARLFFSTTPALPERARTPVPIMVDLWHWKDPQLQTVQKVNAEQDRKRSYRAVLHLASKRVVQLATPDLPSLTPADQGTYALGSGDAAYRRASSWDGEYDDYTLVNLTDGSTRPIVQKARGSATLSPNGTYAIYFDPQDKAWYSMRVSDGRKTNLTGTLPVNFAQEDMDTPDVPRPYGIAGWTDGDRGVWLYDRFDIWEVQPDGRDAHRITNGVGRQQQIIFRYVSLDPAQRAIPTATPRLLSAIDERTRASGFYRLDPKPSAPPVKLLMIDKAAGVPIKARDADRLVVSFERFEEFPNLWASNMAFDGLQQVTDANPQHAQYAWGRSELIAYRNADGKMLQAVLTKPEDFDPSKKYPLLVNIYERISWALHRHTAPGPGISVDVSRYVSHGYVVLQPDIVYDTGYPGESALKCVLPAVQAVLAQGFIDPERIGLQGHSWGGYQATYLATRTNMFRAVEAGAPVSNMISAYGGIRWGTGVSRAYLYERTQSRIGGPPWEKPLQYIENSPIFWVDKINTPYLSIHNDADDLVPWYQSIEFFTALRRLGKEAYLFSYNGEKHNLRERENQMHWTIHLAEFFDHYLKGAPRPEWMDKGVPYLERGTRDLTQFYGPGHSTRDR